ncbi:MAG: transposase [Sphingomonas bacterium]|uniref:transposase n=1 Tax=Sphingomonas bacterium TaxID=1895847 RepID=UPI002635E064|nr:transposase [Sphingomonas bacterium]MDB5702997.1 transposase [Sphingomonas bacterium]
MARLARIVVPDVAHHVTQRGNRRQPVFFSDADYATYRDLVAAACAANGVRCLAWCLMSNHVHLILVPSDADGLRAALAEAHRRYSRGINLAHGWTGYLWQGRFASYPMDDARLLTAIRYVELNPVTAGLVARAEAWPWSSAPAHVTGKPDGLTDLKGTRGLHRNWRAMLRHGLEAGDMAPDEAAAIESRLRTGRPLGDEAFVDALEIASGRALKPLKRGRPKRELV